MVSNIMPRHAPDSAITRSAIIEPVGCNDETGSRHILNHESWIAGNVTRQMTRHQPRPQIIFLTRCGARHETDLFATEKVCLLRKARRQR